MLRRKNTQKFTTLCLSASFLLLSGCQAFEDVSIPKEEFFAMAEKDSPKIDGVQQTLLNSAQRAEKERQYERALQFYRQLHDKDKRNITYQIGLADNYRRLKRTEDAIRAYDTILSIQPDNIEALEGKGLAHLSETDFKKASPLFEEIMARDPQRWRTLNAVGILFIAKEMPNEALAYFQEALRVEPDEPAILNNVGLTMALKENYPRAIRALEAASSRLDVKSPRRHHTDMNLALVYGLSGDLAAAEQVASLHLSEAALNNNLGFYAYLADNRELAKGYLNHALSGSAVFYEKAWTNLQALEGSGYQTRTPQRKQQTAKPLRTIAKPPADHMAGIADVTSKRFVATPAEKPVSFPDRSNLPLISADADQQQMGGAEKKLPAVIAVPHQMSDEAASKAGKKPVETEENTELSEPAPLHIFSNSIRSFKNAKDKLTSAQELADTAPAAGNTDNLEPSSAKVKDEKAEVAVPDDAVREEMFALPPRPEKAEDATESQEVESQETAVKAEEPAKEGLLDSLIPEMPW
jgi:Flp pilus assembly protein TadD